MLWRRGDSPVSNDGRGLKHQQCGPDPHRAADSPVSNDGRGLKQLKANGKVIFETIRPSAMTGVD
jgi:hypothetical protein